MEFGEWLNYRFFRYWNLRSIPFKNMISHVTWISFDKKPASALHFPFLIQPTVLCIKCIQTLSNRSLKPSPKHQRFQSDWFSFSEPSYHGHAGYFHRLAQEIRWFEIFESFSEIPRNSPFKQFAFRRSRSYDRIFFCFFLLKTHCSLRLLHVNVLSKKSIQVPMVSSSNPLHLAEKIYRILTIGFRKKIIHCSKFLESVILLSLRNLWRIAKLTISRKNIGRLVQLKIRWLQLEFHCYSHIWCEYHTIEHIRTSHITPVRPWNHFSSSYS